MNGKENATGQRADEPLGCADCQDGLQEYLDGTLDKQLSLRYFLHLRDCQACTAHHAQWQGLFEMLDSLPAPEVPAGFDAAVLASVPYAAYRSMEPMRRERVPVYLTESFLPGYVRSRVTRWTGVSLSAVAAAGTLAMPGVWWLPVAAVAGLVPELLVLLQGLGRRVVALGRAGS